MFTLIVLYGCSSPRIDFTDYKNTVSDYSKNKFLSEFEAKDSIFSMIFFTSVFEKDFITVGDNTKILFNDTITSDKSLGLAKVVRINNTFDVKITDNALDYSFILKKKNNMKYKYIYISKKRYDNNKYEITYSNSLKAFY